MDGSSPSPPGSPAPPPPGHYDVRNMCEDDFEKLAVYMVPDVPCPRGTAARAHRTLPRSLILKPSLVFSTPNAKVYLNTLNITCKKLIYCIFFKLRLKEYGAQVSYQEAPDLAPSKVFPHLIHRTMHSLGDTSGG